MTGEVTLRGKVLEIGGVKEKVLAAYRAGIRDIILPGGNERDLREVPDDVRDAIKFEFVERMDRVLGLALLAPMAAPEESAPEAQLKLEPGAKQRRTEEAPAQKPRAAAASKGEKSRSHRGK